MDDLKNSNSALNLRRFGLIDWYNIKSRNERLVTYMQALHDVKTTIPSYVLHAWNCLWCSFLLMFFMSDFPLQIAMWYELAMWLLQSVSERECFQVSCIKFFYQSSHKLNFSIFFSVCWRDFGGGGISIPISAR